MFVIVAQVPTKQSTCADMNQTDPSMCLGMLRFEALVSFAKDAGLRLVFGLNAVYGRPGHAMEQPLDLTNIGALLAYAAEHHLPVYGVELGSKAWVANSRNRSFRRLQLANTMSFCARERMNIVFAFTEQLNNSPLAS